MSEPEESGSDLQAAAEDAEVLARLRQIPAAEWKEITKRLTLFAQDRLSLLRWGEGFALRGKEPFDLAADAIVKVWTRQRRWDPKRDPDLLSFLKDIVRSDTNHLAESSEHRTYQPRLVPPDGIDLAERKTSSDPTPEEELAAQETLSRIRRRLGSDPELQAVLTCLINGHVKPQDIARETGFPRDRVYELVRKLRRRLHSDGHATNDEVSAHARK